MCSMKISNEKVQILNRERNITENIPFSRLEKIYTMKKVLFILLIALIAPASNAWDSFSSHAIITTKSLSETTTHRVAVMEISCSAAGPVLYIDWKMLYISGDRKVHIEIDGIDETDNRKWEVQDGLAWHPESNSIEIAPFLAKLENGKFLKAKLDMTDMEVGFNLDGIREALAPIRSKCNLHEYGLF